MEKDLKIKIKIDKQTGDLKVIRSEISNLDQTIKRTSKNTEQFQGKLKDMAHLGVGIFAIEGAFRALDATIGKVIRTGIEFNKNIENYTAGITALTVATSSNISAMGRHLSISEKYNLAQKEAVKTIKELNRINKETPHTLNQTIQIYKAMYPSMKKAGATTKQMIDLTKKISIAAGAAGVEFNQLLAGVDGLASGTVLANSDFGRFLNSLGLTNKKLKESGDVVGLLEKKFSQFKALDTFDVALSNATNSFSTFAGELTKPIFDSLKQDLKEISHYLDDNKEKLIDYTNNIADIGGSILTIYTGGKLLQGIYKVTTAIESLAVAEMTLNKIALKNPYVLLAMGLYGGYEAIKNNMDEINKSHHKGLFGIKDDEKYKQTLQSLKDDLAEVNKKLKDGVGLWDKLFSRTSATPEQLRQQAKVIELKIKQLKKDHEEIKKESDSLTPQIDIVKKAKDTAKAIDDVYKSYWEGGIKRDYEMQLKIYEDEKRKAKDLKGFISSMQKEIADPYEKLILQRDEYLKKYGKDATARLLIDKWYNKELEKLNQKKAKAYDDKAKKELEKQKEQLKKQKEAYEAWIKDNGSLMDGMVAQMRITSQSMASEYIMGVELMKTATNSFENSLTSFFDYASNKFLSFRDLATSILHDIYMNIVKTQIVSPLTSSLTGLLGGLFTPSNVAPNLALSLKGYATGGVFENGSEITKFATGGVVTSPTYFPMASSTGLMGEAGAEAIMPLTRVGGDLGVKAVPANVNIIVENKTGIPVDFKKVAQQQNDDGSQTIAIVMNAIDRNPDFREAIKGIR